MTCMTPKLLFEASLPVEEIQNLDGAMIVITYVGKISKNLNVPDMGRYPTHKPVS